MNCGVLDHDDDCLCDVVIVNPTPVNYHFDQVWHADIVARSVGYDGEDGPKLAEFLAALAYGYDATRQVAAADDTTEEEVVHDHTASREKLIAWLRSGESIVDAPAHLGLSFATCVRILSDNRAAFYWAWDEATWARFEDELNANPPRSDNSIAKDFGISPVTLPRLARCYGKRTRKQLQTAAKGRLVELMRQGIGPHAAVALARKEGHLTATTSMANYLKRQGKV